ncbi:patatin-like phospholipase family protein [Lacticigenium naphthae]|uniref:patatin-like phospholipase family protein n=1 Tax=Lacticigenium naphthae TaxID=515351 RepID=UPI000413AA8B|nr:patatin-like phospholipase family protein [Lacticigenium naphthae]
MDPCKKTALVFGGGGAKGSFQLGVWKALEELKVNVDIVTGSSVGALNAVMYAQGKREIAEDLWREIELNNILAIEMQNTENKTQVARELFKESILKQGISTEPLLKLIRRSIENENAIRQSSIKLGITVTNFKTLQTEYYTLEDIPNGQLANYLLASASFFPAMEKVKIQGKYYIDGGIKDNIPIDFAVKLGGNQFIVVDVQGPGLSKSVNPTLNKKIIMIQTPWDLGGLLVFNRERMHLNSQLGYLETKKVLTNDYMGRWYTFNQQDWQDEQDRFYQFLAKRLSSSHAAYQHPIFIEESLQIHVIKKLKEEWGLRVKGETLPLALLELIGKSNYIYPDRVFSFQSFKKELKERIENNEINKSKDQYLQEIFLADWKNKTKQKLLLPADIEMIKKVYQALFCGKEKDWLNRIEWLIVLKPTIVILAFYLDYLFSG